MKKASNTRQTIIIAAFCAAYFARPLNASGIQTTTDAVTGSWMGNFAAATNLATRTSTPMVLFWANQNCPECEKLETAVSGNDFKAWQNENDFYIYCFVEGAQGNDIGENANSGAKSFAQMAAGTIAQSKRLSGYPFICLWWPHDDGSFTVTNFTGRTGTMLVRASGRTLAQEFEDSIEFFFDDYEPTADLSADFKCSDAANDRLEVEADTPFVDVPLVRETGRGVSTNSLVAAYAGRNTTNDIVWASGETARAVRLNLKVWNLAAGGEIALTLLGNAGDGIQTSRISIVDSPVNSTKNPHWVGELDSASLPWGEWTLDYETARAKCIAEGGRLLALFSGVLWCPYCAGCDASLLAPESDFYAWARDNKVALVLFDQGRASSPATAAGTRAPRLVTREPDPKKTGDEAVSGASYVSRKGVTTAASEVYMALVTKKTAAWLAPEATAARLSNPTILLVDPVAETVTARFTAWRTSDRVYAPHQNIPRLDDLLLLDGRTDGGEANGYISTTKLLHAIGGSSTASFQINDLQKAYRLTGLRTGTLTFTVTHPADRPVKLDFIVAGEVLASGENALEVNIPGSVLKSGDAFLRVVGYPTTSVELGATSSVFQATVKSSLEPGTGIDDVALYATFAGEAVLDTLGDVPAGTRVSVRKASGQLPSGVKLVYDDTTGEVLLSGAPRKAGNYTFTYTVMIGRKKSDPVSVDVTVADPQEENPYVNTSTKCIVPLCSTSVGTSRLIGTATVSLSRNGKIQALYTDLEDKLQFSGAWQDLDTKTGVASAVLVKGSETLELELAANGVITVTRGDASGSSSLAPCVGFAGTYNLTLPVVDKGGRLLSGTGYAILTVKDNGAAKLKGVYPDGSTFSASSTLSLDPKDAGYALIPVLARSSKNAIAFLARVQAKASTLYADEQTVRVVRLPTDYEAIWLHTENGTTTVTPIETYGGYFVKGLSLEDWIAFYNLGDTLAVHVDDADVTDAVSVKYAKSNGVLTAKLNLTLADGSVVKATCKGLLMPGWVDCLCAEEEFKGQFVERPFGSGSAVYKKKVNGRNTTISVPFDLIVK